MENENSPCVLQCKELPLRDRKHISLCCGSSAFCVALGVHRDPEVLLYCKKRITTPPSMILALDIYFVFRKVYFHILFQVDSH